MTDTATAAPQGTPAPIVPPVVAAQPAAPVAPPIADDPDLVKMPSAKLKERLDESKAKGAKEAAAQFAADLGVDLDTAKKLIADAKAREDAQKSEVQRLTEQLAAERAKLARLPVLEETVTARASLEFGALTPEQQAAVTTLAGADPAARLKTIDALKPTWTAAKQQADAIAQATAQAAQEATAKAAADAAAEAAKKAKVPAGATTAPAAPPPVPAQPGTPTNHLAVWEALRVTNPIAAGVYRSKHNAAIVAAQRNATG